MTRRIHVSGRRFLAGSAGAMGAAFLSRMPLDAMAQETTPAHLDLEDIMPPVEDHGFTLVDFLSDRIVLRQFAWDVDQEPLDAIDRLEPIFTTELERPG